MKVISALFLVVFSSVCAAGGVNDNSPLIQTCLTYLTPAKKVTLGEVRNFKFRPVRFTVKDEPTLAGEEVLHLYTHPWLESLYFLEPPDFKRMDERETGDAIRYAAYLKRKGLAFIFVSTYLKLSVPEFDGIVFDPKTGRALWNVSMKHAQLLHLQMTPAEFRESFPVWANHSPGNELTDRQSWFAIVNSASLSKLKRTPDSREVGLANFQRFKILSLAFGLFNERGHRPFHLVRDLSDWRMTFEISTRPEYLRPAEEVIRRIQTNHVTYIWSEDHVLEYPHN
jgi:hypothetical protein